MTSVCYALGTITLTMDQLIDTTYDVGATKVSPYTVSILSNPADISVCGNLVTEFLYSSGTALTGDPFTYSATNGFSIYTADTSKTGTHEMRA